MSLRLSPSAGDRVVLERRPRFEGSNIGTWIGFKHVMYLVEEGALQFLREQGVVAGSLFERYGLCLEIVDCDVRIVRALEMDDLVRIEVGSRTRASDDELRLGVEIFVGRHGQVMKAASAEVRVLFREAGGHRCHVEPPPPELVPYLKPEIRRSRPSLRPRTVAEGRGGGDGDPLRELVPRGANSFVWRWHVPYFYCHFTERMQHSGYVRVLEEVVDLFLADRGISIQTLLRDREWIPVVADARVEILADAFMEETLYTVFTLEDIFKRMRFSGRMDCYVPRDGRLIHTATGRITHGYLRIADRGTKGSLAIFDDTVMAALAGEGGAA
jgi:acyl-CoA thioesterase FadM